MAQRSKRSDWSWKLVASLCVAMAASSVQAAQTAQDGDGLGDDWPRQLDVKGVEILIYQPQPESFEGTTLKTRAAISVTRQGESEPTFGVVWVACRVETDRDAREVYVQDMVVDRVRFPEATLDEQNKLARLIEESFPSADLTLSLDRLLTSLSVIEQVQTEVENLETEAPKILFVTTPTVLVTIDGEPKLKKLKGKQILRVVNTPFNLVLDTQTSYYYLDGGAVWYRAKAFEGPWKTVMSVPADVAALRPKDSTGDDPAAEPAEESLDSPPDVLVAVEPTEVIVTEGEPTWSPLEGGQLLYLSNSESDVLMEIAEQKYFVVLSGRWYVSDGLEGPWEFVQSDALPASFARIAEDSKMGHIRSFVAGTVEAEDAVLDNQIPQTAAIERSSATVEVKYDGEPEFEPIDGTEMTYAVNTTSAVIWSGGLYYCCHEAVWFVAHDPLGPWAVCDEVPKEIYTLPPSCPHYNVRYVYVYRSTPEVVYVGYTPGYVGSYVYHTTIVYGTGFYYRPWYRRYYYARPATWGFHARWNPWRGWRFGFGVSTGRFTFSVGVGRGFRGGWWGPAHYRGYRRGYNRGFQHGYRRGVHAGYRAGRRSAHNNVYRNSRNRNSTRTRTQSRSRTNQTAQRNRSQDRSGTAQRNRSSSTRGSGNRTRQSRNNVYADRNGNVHRRTQNGWESRQGKSWERQSTRPNSNTTRPSNNTTRRSSNQSRGRSSRGSLNASHQARQRGSSRTRGYRGGGARGGRR